MREPPRLADQEHRFLTKFLFLDKLERLCALVANLYP
jgi:hypothetical protein